MGSSSDVSGNQQQIEESTSLRRIRPSRACTVRAQQRLQEQQAAERKLKLPKKENKRRKEEEEEEEEEEEREEEEEEEEEEEDEKKNQKTYVGSSSKVVTSLVSLPEPSQMPRWNLRSMWELASVLDFLHVFRPLLKINVEFTAEEFETALLSPNDTLSDIHIPLIKAIPPITRMALTRDTWVTVLCRKIRDCWHWVAEGDIPIVASQGRETEIYKSLDPAIRVVILKALCDIRVEQDDIKSYIDNSLKTGTHMSAFRKDRVGGDSHGVNFWYEADPLIGHRLYREIRNAEEVKDRTKGSKVLPNLTYQWETVATNFDEFQDVSEKLNASSSRVEVSLGKKLTRDMLPEIEKEHKRREKLLKKQHRQALLLDNYMVVDGLGPGRSRRDRKPVRYTFDDYDKSINEAIKINKNKHPSAEPPLHRRESARLDALANGGSTSSTPHLTTEPINDYNTTSPRSDYDDFDESLDRSDRRRQRPQRYSATDFVETVEYESEDDIVGEAVYDEEYMKKRKQKFSSGSEGEEEEEEKGDDEEYKWEEDNAEYEEEEEEEEEDSPSGSEEEDSDDDDDRRRVRKMPRRGVKSRSSRRSNDYRPGLRRSKRATRVDYQQYEFSDSDKETKGGLAKRRRLVEVEEEEEDETSDETGHMNFTMGSEGSEENHETKSVEEEVNDKAEIRNGEENDNQLKISDGIEEEGVEGKVGKRRYLDLNELAPVSGYDDGPSTVLKDDDKTDNS